MWVVFKSSREEIIFKTVTDAYKHYLRHYAEWLDYAYYKYVCGYSLTEVTDETIMEAIFRNVFMEAIIIVKGKRND